MFCMLNIQAMWGDLWLYADLLGFCEIATMQEVGMWGFVTYSSESLPSLCIAAC
jgi:hypothetical protein